MNSISFLVIGVVVDFEELIYFIFVVKFKCVKLFRIIFWTPAMPVVISPDTCNVCSNMFCIIPDAGIFFKKKKIHLAGSLPIVSIFSKNQFSSSLIFFIVFLFNYIEFCSYLYYFLPSASFSLFCFYFSKFFT